MASANDGLKKVSTFLNFSSGRVMFSFTALPILMLPLIPTLRLIATKSGRLGSRRGLLQSPVNLFLLLRGDEEFVQQHYLLSGLEFS